MNRSQGAVGFSIFSFLFSGSLFAATFYVERTTGPGLPDSDLETTTELVMQGVSSAGEQIASDTASADFILKPRMLRLGNAYVLSLQKWRKTTLIFSSQLKAATIDELDKVATRVTASVIHGAPADQDARVGQITNYESQEGTQRRPTRHLSYFGIGGGNLGNLAIGDVGYGFYLARVWDLNSFAVKLSTDLMFQGSALWIDGTIGGAYFFSDKDFSPFLGADFGFAVTKTGVAIANSEVRAGFVLGAEAGVQVFRTREVNLEVGVKGAFLFQTNSFGTPTLVTGRVGLYF